jgi:2-polyprenyl-3-methyl-5-hydroxy-6-metoxy-1,4-benzoquinol methylase
MRSLTILRGAIQSLRMPQPPQRILELGAGDGSLMLRFAQSAGWRDVEVTFLDRQALISAETRGHLQRLGWIAQSLTADALDWARDSSPQKYDLCITTLFLHHFQAPELRPLQRAVASRCQRFVALEPRRNGMAWIGSHLLGLLGANAVTREDGVTSVIAGFADHELGGLWPSGEIRWRLQEYFAWPFTHCFVADRGDGTDPSVDAQRP